MAKGQHLSRYQEGIVRRYYQHLDSTQIQRLQEIVSDLFMASGDAKKSERLWKRAQETLEKVGANPAELTQVIGSKSIEKLAALVNGLSAPKK